MSLSAQLVSLDRLVIAEAAFGGGDGLINHVSLPSARPPTRLPLDSAQGRSDAKTGQYVGEHDAKRAGSPTLKLPVLYAPGLTRTADLLLRSLPPQPFTLFHPVPKIVRQLNF